jgi:hypothetical protein
VYQCVTWLSGNTYGATLWSDGYMAGPMLPAIPDYLSRCPNCLTIFVTNAQVARGKTEEDYPGIKITFLEQVISIEEIQSILQNDSKLIQLAEQFYSSRRRPVQRKKMSLDDMLKQTLRPEKYVPTESQLREFSLDLKISILQKINHLKRNKEHVSELYLQLFKSVASDVIEQLPDQSEDENLILQKAEFCRNLGRFEETRKLLDFVRDNEHKRTRSKLYLASLFRNRKLMKIYRDDAYYRKPLFHNLKNWFRRRFGL